MELGLMTLVTPAEVAARIRCHERTVRRLAERGAFRAQRLDPSDPRSQWRIFIGSNGLPVRSYAETAPAAVDILAEFAASEPPTPGTLATRRRTVRGTRRRTAPRRTSRR